MLTIEEIKKDQDLECIDFLGLVNNQYYITQMERLEKSPKVKVSQVRQEAGIVNVVDSIGVEFELFLEQLKYFRIRRPAPTFDDLIDVAVQAVKDKLIIINAITDWQIQFVRGSDTRYVVSHDHKRISKEIDFINSLYTETFVIESEEDVAKVKMGATVKLVNGNESDVVVLNDPQDSFGVMHAECSLDIFSLYGATVTQKRSAP